MKRLLRIALLLLPLAGCDSEPTARAEDLDLALIVGHLKQEGDADASKLEEWINSTPGVNNVDLDRDEVRDLITIKEEPPEGGKVTLLLVANPKQGQPVALAELQFEKKDDKAYVTAAYSSRVVGGQQDLFQETVAPQSAMTNWLFIPRPIYVNPPLYYDHLGWSAPRPILSPRLVETRRTETRVAPVRRVPRTDTFRSREPEVQRKSYSQQVAPRRDTQATSSSLSSSSGKGANFSLRSDTSSRPKATNVFRSTSPPASTSRPSAPSRPMRSGSSIGSGSTRSTSSTRR
jgi:hypothetical protein